jgi:heat shock protein HslJ
MMKRVATWLPRDLREQLAALDPAAAGESSADRPDLDLVLARAAESHHAPKPSFENERGADGPERNLDELPGRPRRARLGWAVACAIVLVAGLAIGLAAFTSNGHSGPSHPAAVPASRLYGVSWTDRASRATVVFQSGTAHTADGCSGRTQTLSVSGVHLRLGKQVGQAYVCGGTPVPPTGSVYYAEYERQRAALNRFYTVLDSSPTWSIRGDTLTLTAGNGLAIQLTRKGSAPLTLPGTKWVLQEVVTLDPGRGVAGAIEGPTLSFDRRGAFHATDSCDLLSGTAAVAGNTVTFDTVRRTYNDCSPSVGDMKTTIDTMLSSRLTFQVEHNTLRLTKPHTDGQLDYIPASMQPYGTVSGSIVAVGGPYGVHSPRPMIGTGSVQFTNTRTGVSQTVATTTSGSYTTSLTPGRYTIAGHISSYQSGKAACAATRPVTVTRDTTTTTDVYCQER